MPPNPALRIPIKLHKQVTLVRTADPILVEELLARKTLASGWQGLRYSVTPVLQRHLGSQTGVTEYRNPCHLRLP
jgi:hypothetical protein